MAGAHHRSAAADRWIGSYGGTASGPLIIAFGGIHGNEPAGVTALARVLERLAASRVPFRGELAGLAGNLKALHLGVRYLDSDLNRMWHLERMETLRHEPLGWNASVEDREQQELLRAVDLLLARARGEVIFLDLHTSSAEGPPFACISDTLRNRAFAAHFPLPILLGLEEVLEGTILDAMNELGHVCLGVEGGRHDLETSVENLEAIVWTALVAAGCLDPRHRSEAARHRQRLAQRTSALPHFLEIRYRHAVSEMDGFLMVPGYSNFQSVQMGQLLARDHGGEVRALEGGHIVMPLYQKSGRDGFFLARPVRPFWLRLSTLLRSLRADALAALLPGVQPIPEAPGTLAVQPRIARWRATELLHLLGYRRHSMRDGLWMFKRRPETPVRRRRFRERGSPPAREPGEEAP